MLYTFHEYVLDTQRHELRQQGVPVPLERKAYQVLVYLVQQADRLVTKHELLEAGLAAVYVNDSAVARCIGNVLWRASPSLLYTPGGGWAGRMSGGGVQKGLHERFLSVGAL